MELYRAVVQSDLEHVKRYLDEKNLSVNAGTYELLKLALYKQDFAIYQELVQRGAPIAGFEEPGEDTLLHVLARLKNVPYDFYREMQLFMFGKEMLDNGLSVIDLNERDETPIHVAAKYRCAKNLYLFVDELMSQPDQIHNVVDRDGLSLFHIICTMPHTSYVIDFLNHVPSVNMNDAVSFSSKFCPGYTALHFAAAHYRFQTVKILIDLGADMTHVTPTGLTLLHLSCTMHHPDWLFHEISRKVPKKNVEDWAMNVWKNLQTTLQARTSLIEYFLKIGISVNARDRNGHNALYFVASANYMVSHKAVIIPTLNRDIIDQVDTFLYYARPELRENQLQLAVILFVNSLNKTNETVPIFEPRYFYELARDASPDLTYKLIDFLLRSQKTGANIKDENLLTPLHVATQAQWLTMIRCFLQFRDDSYDKMANVNAQDALGNTPLHYIDRQDTGYLNCLIITALVKHGADLNLSNNKGLTGFKKLRRLILYIASLDDFSVIAEEEKSKIELALSMKTDIGPIECNYWVEVLITVWKHLIRLETCNAPTHRGHDELLSELEDCILLSEISVKNGLLFKEYCEEEAKKLKQLHVSKFTCLNDILTNTIHDVAAHTKNEVLINVIKSPELKKQFPIYKDMLRARFISGLARRKLSDEATVSLKILSNRDLPPVCFHKILSYLNDRQLIDIQKAGVSNSKRKSITD